MAKDSGHQLTDLAVDGGMSNSDICMQVCTIQSSKQRITKLTWIPSVPSGYHSNPSRATLDARDDRPRRSNRRRIRKWHLVHVR